MASMKRGDDPFAVVMAALSDGEEFRGQWQGPFRRAIRLHPRRGIATGWGDLVQIPWNPGNYFTAPTCDPGNFLNYHTGTIYPQDAASQVPVILLKPQPGETIIDVCAAPGSKSTQIGLALGDNGLVICCDAAAPRRQIIAENLGRQGITCGLVTPMPVHVLSERYPHVADGVLVDVPCSGHELRSAKQVARMAERQLGILTQAARLVASAGRLVYSTCTPYQAENEEVIEKFLDTHKGWRVELSMLPSCDSDLSGLGAIRLWPHRQGTEPFFACLLRAPIGIDNRGTLQGNRPQPDSFLHSWIPATHLCAWNNGRTRFMATEETACCALPSQARGLLVMHGERDLEPWAAQALIERGAEAHVVTHDIALRLWAGEAHVLPASPTQLVKTEAGAPLGQLTGGQGEQRLRLPSRLFRKLQN